MRFILSGKTTLIKYIDRILKPKESIFLDGRDVEAMSRQDIARYTSGTSLSLTLSQ